MIKKQNCDLRKQNCDLKKSTINSINKSIDNLRNQNDLIKLYGENTNPVNKSYNSYRFKKYSDEEIFNNIDEYINILKEKMGICFNKNCKNDRCNNFIFTYSHKKVGSTALWGSFNLFLSHKYRTFHFHSENELESLGIYNLKINQFIKILKKYKKNVMIIDIYRPIFDNCLSIFFCNLSFEFQTTHKNISENVPVINLIKRFNDLFINYLNMNSCDYFMDVYEIDKKEIIQNFDFEKKHLYSNDETIEFLKLRVCDSKDWNKIFGSYIKDYINIIDYNITENKEIGKIYKEFKDNYEIPKNYYEIIKEDKHFLFYYSKIEQENYLKKFENSISSYNYEPFNSNSLNFYFTIRNENQTGINYSEELMISNIPIVNNCICNNCIKEKKKLFDLYK